MKRAPQAATAPSISGGATASANAAPPAGGASQSAVPAPGGAPNPGALLAAHAADLRKCMRDAGAKEDVTLAIAIANGKPTVKVTSKAAVSAGLDACMKAAVAKIQFSGTSTVTRIVKP